MLITSPIFSVAPMMDYTDRHARYFLRLCAPDVRLYTEMVTTHALKHGDVDYLLRFHPSEKYLALQLGGSDPYDLADCAALGESYGYDEINLNVGCPSPRVSSGRFGACLMLEPHLVAACVAEMKARVSIPVTVKCRIGVDHQESYEALTHFLQTVSAAGCEHFIIHARKAWLKGLSPKENREIPPLHYDIVHQVKKDFPQLTIVINGGIKTLAEINLQLPHVDGIMVGRAAYANPYLLSGIQSNYLKNKTILSRKSIVQHFINYVSNELQNKVKLSAMTRHILGLYTGLKGAAAWRRYLSQHAHQPNAGIEVIEHALSLIE